MPEQTTATAMSGRQSTLFFVLTCYLIATLLYRLFVPAQEYPMRSAQALEIVLDAGCVVGLFGVRSSGPKVLFWIALIAGISLFLIHATSDAAWWTGHLQYSLS